ncbi:chemotaxis protein CheA [Skermanella stibiiresistens SB22]|uniref:Chemotaxis protein CheA n=2 Tax=Skermanella TaxID=204447 RepID=W9HAC4_9PROT|nr:chemotaxis protein CheA [Skermanella stibiiresistens SB22]
MTMTDPIEIFRQEAQELLEQLEASLLDLDGASDGRDLVDTVFRALHTIKGSGAMMGYGSVADFTHDFETAFDRVRNGLVPVSPDLIAVSLAAKDHIRALIETPDRVDPAESERILGDLRHVVDGTDVTATAAPDAPDAVTWRVRFRLAKDAMATGTNPLLLLDELRSLGNATVAALTDTIPPLDEMEADDCHLGWDVTLDTAHPKSTIKEVFMFVIDDMELRIERVEETARSPEPTAPVASPVIAPIAAPIASPEADEPRPERDAAKPGMSLRVAAERLDELMDRVGELVIAQARLTQLAAVSADPNVKSVAEELERLTSGLRDTTMGIRMVPIGSLFGRFRRLVHDLSRSLGKRVDLITAGEGTELDKTMIERLAEPVVHLIRNAIDHGLEGPDERADRGKPATGTLRLVARHAGAEVLVSIIDDGRGLDRDRIRAKAEERGLLAPGTEIADGDLFQFLFHPGFSTAREISAVSGRGVGMDVVKRTVEGLHGGIDIATTPGRGTVVTLRLPLTLAIIDGLLVRVGQGRYVIPLSAVEECVALTLADDTRSKGRSFLNIRDDLVPFMRLRDLFMTNLAPDPHQRVVIVASGDFRVGLVVDQIIGSHQTVIKSLSRLHADVETFSGATILGDGTLALILDVAQLVELGRAREERQGARRLEVA